ncbi:hypothetical protein FAES_2789 [Fibrella aestuarina BUZ 2]|uniref:Uncharacterized protein n=1 Tax=Fibrella aestuarina BUZ 2 TaxID=1166018 RepID=I0K9J5_9BACT|nr:hypothetical protein [Fibrella aestuarina]CCH00798.1 hypothetical protein FAES_2789 [Fibrella aestuarina BUZ 2]
MPSSTQLHSPATDISFYWEDTGWVNPPFDEYRIAELDLPTFTQSGTLDAAAQQVVCLKKEGINTVIIAVSRLGAPAGKALEPTDKLAQQLRHFIDICHYEGIAVCLDVDYSPWQQTPDSQARIIANALMWFGDFHVDALRLADSECLPNPDQTLRSMRRALNQLTTQTGRQYYLLVDCEASPVTVREQPRQSGASSTQRFLCPADQPQSVQENPAPTHHTSRLSAKRIYRRDYLYDSRFARLLRTFFGRKKPALSTF